MGPYRTMETGRCEAIEELILMIESRVDGWLKYGYDEVRHGRVKIDSRGCLEVARGHGGYRYIDGMKWRQKRRVKKIFWAVKKRLDREEQERLIRSALAD